MSDDLYIRRIQISPIAWLPDAQTGGETGGDCYGTGAGKEYRKSFD
jgi:hypothetical protein